jgi:hypothetical protein
MAARYQPSAFSAQFPNRSAKVLDSKREEILLCKTQRSPRSRLYLYQVVASMLIANRNGKEVSHSPRSIRFRVWLQTAL